MVPNKSLQNLKPFVKGDTSRLKNGRGRPKKLDWTLELNTLAMTPEERIPFLRRLLRIKPDIAMHYLAGKPREMITLESTINQSISVSTIELAVAAARTMLDAPLSLPSEQIKVAHIEAEGPENA
jgi:hypothetical protein